MNLKKEILKKSGLLREGEEEELGYEKFHITKVSEWLGKTFPDDKDIFDSLEKTKKCAKCNKTLGDKAGADGMEFRMHRGGFAGFSGKNYHHDCFEDLEELIKSKDPNSLVTYFPNSNDYDGGDYFYKAEISGNWMAQDDYGMDDEW